MDIYDEAHRLLLQINPLSQWVEMQEALRRIIDKRPFDWQLPLLACQAVGGSVAAAIPAIAAVACAQISIILIDDMLDVDPYGAHLQFGMPATANLAVAFQAVGQQALQQSQAPAPVQVAALHSLSQMMATTAWGQHGDVQNPADEVVYWQVVQTKSAPFFGAALEIGALLGGADGETAVKIKAFGALYGEMIQIHDDLNDAMATPADPDWVEGRSPLPILFAQLVDHPDRDRFHALRAQVAIDAASLAAAQQILIACGAVSYCLDQLLRRYKQSQAVLAAIPNVDADRLATLLAVILDPVRDLLASLGLPDPETLLALLEEDS